MSLPISLIPTDPSCRPPTDGHCKHSNGPQGTHRPEPPFPPPLPASVGADQGAGGGVPPSPPTVGIFRLRGPVRRGPVSIPDLMYTRPRQASCATVERLLKMKIVPVINEVPPQLPTPNSRPSLSLRAFPTAEATFSPPPPVSVFIPPPSTHPIPNISLSRCLRPRSKNALPPFAQILNVIHFPSSLGSSELEVWPGRLGWPSFSYNFLDAPEAALQGGSVSNK